MELLVVMAVIAIVAGFAVPAVTTMLRGSQLTQGSQMVVDQIALARQTALSRNRSVEVRFYKFPDAETPGEDSTKPDTWLFHGLQTFEVLDNGAKLPLGPIQRLPQNVIINEAGLSTLINEQRDVATGDFTKPTDADPEMPDKVVGRNYRYASLRFLPDGSTDLPPTGTVKTKGDSWYIALHGTNEKDSRDPTLKDGKIKTLPPNYFILQIDPITGSTRSYRPNVGS